MEENSLATVCMHLRHVIASLGESFRITSLTPVISRDTLTGGHASAIADGR